MIGCFQWVIYLWQRTAGPSSFFSFTACASIWTGRSAIAGNIWMHWNTRKDSSRTHKMVVLYCVCVCWIQCFDLPCVTATFWLRIGLTGSFLNQGWDPEGLLQDSPVTSHVIPWGQQWMKSSQHTAYWENTVILSNYLPLCSTEERKVKRMIILWNIWKHFILKEPCYTLHVLTIIITINYA